MTDDIEELRRLAMAATPGPWFAHVYIDMSSDDARPGVRFISAGMGNLADDVDEHDAAYIAAANPTAILRLLDAWEADRKGREEAERRLAIADDAHVASEESLVSRIQAASREIAYWNADARRMSACLLKIHQAPDTASVAALKSVAYDAALNCITPDVAEYQIEWRSAVEREAIHAAAERSADAREG